jgi:hypothetical protein
MEDDTIITSQFFVLMHGCKRGNIQLLAESMISILSRLHIKYEVKKAPCETHTRKDLERIQTRQDIKEKELAALNGC